MRKFVISGLVGLLLLGVGLLKISGKTESIAFAQLSEGEMEVVESETQVSHANDEMLTGRKVTWLSPEEMSIIRGGACSCYQCVTAPNPGELCGMYGPCTTMSNCSGHEDPSCGWIGTGFPPLLICEEVESNGKTECENNINTKCRTRQKCTCQYDLEYGWVCQTVAYSEFDYYDKCNLTGSSC